MEDLDPRRVSFYRVRIKINGVEPSPMLPNANVKLKLCGRDNFTQNLRIFWSTDKFGDQSHKETVLPTGMEYRSHQLQNPHDCAVKPIYAYGIEITKGVIIPGTANSKDGFTLVARRCDIAGARQETSGPIIQGKRTLRIENWWYAGKFPAGWIDTPLLDPNTLSGYVIFEFRALYDRDRSAWEPRWETSLAKKVCVHNDWRSFWWEGFSKISVLLSRAAENPTAIRSTTTLNTSSFASYPKPESCTGSKDRGTQTSPEPEYVDDSTAPGESTTAPTVNSLATAPVAPGAYTPTKMELLEEASQIFIRAMLEKMRNKEPEDDLWSYD
ncbi:hypothetical protein TWF730_010745 [Orbilia blumenaviensis]|uniref:Uncharacterized protein n=1 Tax=Orbilia blumenaviensis TaxID=1796055 RepID=A0AAV9UP61_9PEZI